MPKIIIPRDSGAGRSASTSSAPYDAMDIADRYIMKLEKRGTDTRLSFEDPQNIIIYTGEDV